MKDERADRSALEQQDTSGMHFITVRMHPSGGSGRSCKKMNRELQKLFVH